MSVYEIAYHFPVEKLNAEFEKVFDDRILIEKPDGYQFRGFYLMPPTDLALEVGRKCVRDLRIPCEQFIVNFLYLEANAQLPWHIDEQGSISSLNVNIGKSQEPIEFEEGNYHYEAALVDTKKLHRLCNGPDPRRIFRITFQEEDATFDRLKSALESNEY